MAHGVFRHALEPPEDLRELRMRTEPEDGVQLVEHHLDHARIVEVMHELLVMAPADERADHDLVIWRAERPLDRGIRGRVDPPPLYARHDESESLERDLHVLLAEGDRDSGG